MSLIFLDLCLLTSCEGVVAPFTHPSYQPPGCQTFLPSTHTLTTLKTHCLLTSPSVHTYTPVYNKRPSSSSMGRWFPQRYCDTVLVWDLGFHGRYSVLLQLATWFGFTIFVPPGTGTILAVRLGHLTSDLCPSPPGMFLYLPGPSYVLLWDRHTRTFKHTPLYAAYAHTPHPYLPYPTACIYTLHRTHTRVLRCTRSLSFSYTHARTPGARPTDRGHTA